MSFVRSTPPQADARLPKTTAMSSLRALIGFLLGLLLCFAAAGLVDTRELDGANVWLKPAKFALSFVVLYATLAWVVHGLSPAMQASRTLRVTLGAMALATWTEMAYIGARAGLGVHSHFAVDTPAEALLYSLIGLVFVRSALYFLRRVSSTHRVLIVGTGAEAKVRGRELRQVLVDMALVDHAIVDIGSSNIEAVYAELARMRHAHQEFDCYVVPAAPTTKQQRDTINTLVGTACPPGSYPEQWDIVGLK